MFTTSIFSLNLENVSRRLAHAILPIESVEQRPVQVEKGAVHLALKVDRIGVAEGVAAVVTPHRARQPKLGHELGPRLLHLGLPRAQSGEAGGQIGPAHERPVHHVLHRDRKLRGQGQ